MKKDSIEAVDDSAIMGLVEQQGEAKYSLCENAAAAARGARRQLTLRAAVVIGLALSLVQWGAGFSYGKYHSGYWFWETEAEVTHLKAENHSLRGKLHEETKAKEVAQSFFVKLKDLRALDDAVHGLVDASHARLEGEVTRLASENTGLVWKNNWKSETLAIFYATHADSPSELERSRTMNVLRDEPLEFVNWTRPDLVVEAMLKLEAWKCLEWVVEQPDWYSCLNTDTHRDLVAWEEGHKKTQALEIYNDLPLISQQAIDRLAASVRKNGVEKTLLHLESEQLEQPEPDKAIVKIELPLNATDATLNWKEVK